MKILMVSSYFPYPLFSGGHIRLYNLIKHLSKRHKITLVCEKRDYQKDQDIKEVEKFCEKIVILDRKTQWSFGNIIKTGFSFSPFLIIGHTISAMKRKLKELLEKEHFDLIHVETSYVMQNLPKTQVPIVLVEHNIEYLVYKRFAENAPIFLRPFLYIDVLKLKYWEEAIWDKVAKLIAVSEIEKKIMEREREGVEVVPNGVDIDKFKVQSSRLAAKRAKFKVDNERRILFIGDFKWVQNRDAAGWMIKDIWPHIKSKVNPRFNRGQKSKVDLKLWVVGRKIPENIKSFGGDNVFFDENAPADTALIYQRADVLLAPIKVGGGTSFKILEAMASGVPVVTTHLGNEGIGAKNGDEILIVKDSYDFAEKTLEILNNNNLYKKISKNARKFIEEKYDWRLIVKKLEYVYESLAV